MVLWREGTKEAPLPTSTEKTRLPFQFFFLLRFGSESEWSVRDSTNGLLLGLLIVVDFL